MTTNQPPAPRRNRSAAHRTTRAGTRPPPAKPRAAWQSPIALLTGAALLVGVAIVFFAVLSQPRATAAPTDGITQPTSSVPAGLADGRTLGSAKAPVTIDIWADFQCPYCGQLARYVEPPLIDQFVATGYARLVFHDMAFLGEDSSGWNESVEAASAARCAADQGLFWQMHDWLFANQNGENEGAFAQARLRSIAQAAGLDMTAYDSCMAAGDKQASVKSDSSADFATGIHSTPTIKVNGVLYKDKLTTSDLGAAIMNAVGTSSPAALPSLRPASAPQATSAP